MYGIANTFEPINNDFILFVSRAINDKFTIPVIYETRVVT